MAAQGIPANLDVRALVRALVNPASNEQYVRDQQTLTECFKEPGEYRTVNNVVAKRVQVSSSLCRRLLPTSRFHATSVYLHQSSQGAN